MGVLRKTKNLERVLAAFADEGGALTAKAVLDLMPSGVNKTTVYRLLERLKDDGVLHSFTSGDGVVHYAKCHACPNSAHAILIPTSSVNPATRSHALKGSSRCRNGKAFESPKPKFS